MSKSRKSFREYPAHISVGSLALLVVFAGIYGVKAQLLPSGSLPTPATVPYLVPKPSTTPAVGLCGDGVWGLRFVAPTNVITLEQCDDGNTFNGDGCAGDCMMEPGWGCYVEDGRSVCSKCGNGVVEGVEQCDDGNRIDGDGCSMICKFEAACGNAIREPAGYDTTIGTSDDELCDDGNTLPGDGCGDRCKVETGYACTEDSTQLSTCIIHCGDSVVTPPEQCDDGGNVSGDGCDDTCQLEPGGSCGNGAVSPNGGDGDPATLADNEECDDGNLVDGDGCNYSCRLEAGVICGDGILSPHGADRDPSTTTDNEECDDGNLVDGDLCTDNCTLPLAGFCGDGTAFPDGPDGDPATLADNEECDDGNLTNGDECSSSCKIENNCGNGLWNNAFGQEECDDGNSNNYDACLDTCKKATCGDGYKRTGVEECDDGNTLNGDLCPSTCVVHPNVCGNSIIDPGEECDPRRVCVSNLSNPLMLDTSPQCVTDADCTSIPLCRAAPTATGGPLRTCGGILPGMYCSFDIACAGNMPPNDQCLPVKTCAGSTQIPNPDIAYYEGNTCVTDADCTSLTFTCKKRMTTPECSDDCHIIIATTTPIAPIVPGTVVAPLIAPSVPAKTSIAPLRNPIEAVCGDGVAAPSEGCDDGDTVSGDGCSAGCEIEAASVASEPEADAANFLQFFWNWLQNGGEVP